MSLKRTVTSNEIKLLIKPHMPTPEECCGSGCVPCIFDYYYDALEKWQEQQLMLTKKPAKANEP